MSDKKHQPFEYDPNDADSIVFQASVSDIRNNNRKYTREELLNMQGIFYEMITKLENCGYGYISCAIYQNGKTIEILP